MVKQWNQQNIELRNHQAELILESFWLNCTVQNFEEQMGISALEGPFGMRQYAFETEYLASITF